MGGLGAWRIAAAHPEVFAAVVPISGGGNPADAKRLLHVPIWAFHGELDEIVPLEQGRRMVDAVSAAGGMAKLTVLSGVGHGICERVCERSDVWDWLLRQHLSTNGDVTNVESTQ
jgi:predicted peptidase